MLLRQNMQTKIGVLVLMLDQRKKNKNLSPRPLDTLKNTEEYEIIFGDHLSYTENGTYIQNRKVDILFDRYPYQKYMHLSIMKTLIISICLLLRKYHLMKKCQ